MKIIIIGGVVFIVLFTAFQLYAVMSGTKTQSQPYTVVKSMKNFEIRHYPSATMAMITSHSTSYRELGTTGFKKLAGYIFGGNSEKKQIAMTSPVHMDLGDTVSTMSFVMPSHYTKNSLPVPDNSEVTIAVHPEEYVAAIQFGGFASPETIQKQTDLLVRSLLQAQIGYYGHFRMLGYNPPYQLLDRRNEIIVKVIWP
ncbi:MAG: SOUL family heme-binding protein [Cyclobacteriaceae bacterium]|jgi:hypothetical protein